MKSEEIRKKFLDFFKKRGHRIIPSSSLIPQDPTSLFTSAGMQQLASYLEGKKDVLEDFGTRHLASVQKCFRTGDIEEVGDGRHHTFFEMLGNWSIGEDEGGYFKEGAIKYAIEFFCDVLGLDKNRIWVTIFKGEKGIPRDEESFLIWQKFGIPKERIKEFGMEENFWGPVTETGPCGPCSEIYYDRGEKFGCQSADCGPNCPRCERFIELWNLVFMEYDRKVKSQKSKVKSYEYKKLPQRNVDTGIGLERLVSVLQNKESDYETDLFWPLIQEIEKYSEKNYFQEKRNFRILADHLRGASFLIAEGVFPSNIDRGYVLRRILRRIQRIERVLKLKEGWLSGAVKWIVRKYQNVYPELANKENDILIVLEKEKEKFEGALKKGLKYFEKLIAKKLKENSQKVIEGKEAFFLYESYGFPLEMTQEIARDYGFTLKNKEDFFEAFRRHQEISRRGAEKKFGGAGIEKIKNQKSKIKITKLHTATHLLQAALREVLGKEVRQMGSDINPERLRFDFSFPRKMTAEELKKVEDLVNKKIKEGLEVKMEEMPLEKALKSGALGFFKEKYPPRVKVYTIFNPQSGEIFSKEICGGPHVKRTSELGEFKIQKEESLGRGVRRIRAILRPNS